MEVSRKKRMIQIGSVLLVCGFLIVSRLFYLIVIEGDEYIARAQEERVKTIAVDEFERGDILDCRGESFTNREENCLVIFPQLITDEAWLAAEVAAIIGKNDFASVTIDWRQKLTEREPFIVRRDLGEGEVIKYQQEIEKRGLVGVFVLTLRPRYELSFPACHVIGFVGEADEEETLWLEEQDLSLSTMVGKSGLEYQYNEFLTGAAGEEVGVMTDERSQQTSEQLRLLDGEERQDMGYDLKLTLNRDYQQFLDEAMADKKGGAVLMDVKTGDILAVSSSPGYDQYQGQTEAQGNDYVNKAFSYYPPASVFKTVLVLAALEEGIDCDDDFVCTGSIRLGGGHQVHCWEEDGHGGEDLRQALANSCNPYFVQLGQQLGGRKILEYAHNLGLGEQKIIGYAVNSLQENLSFDPRAEADVANASIGENGVRLSPLLVARLMSAIANGGQVVTPRLVEGIYRQDGSLVRAYESAEPRQVISRHNCQVLQEYLRYAVIAGTGSPVNSSVVEIAGKTGTSQDAGVWFAGFAPVSEPRYAIAVYDEEGESGGSDAGKVAKVVLEKIAVLEGFR